MGLTRREFLKSCGAAILLAAWMRGGVGGGAARSYVPVLWLLASGCCGCSTSLLESVSPGAEGFLVGFNAYTVEVRVVLHPLFSVAAGDEYLSALRAAAEGSAARLPGGGVVDFSGGYVLVLEGSFPVCSSKPGGDVTCMGRSEALYCYIGFEGGEPVTCTEWLRRLLGNARAVISAGNCASYGGVRAAEAPSYSPSGLPVTGSIGFFPDPVRERPGLIDLLAEAERFRRGEEPALAVPGCPVNGEALARSIVAAALVAAGLLDAGSIGLDEYHRPLAVYRATTHEQCPRLGEYLDGVFREEPGEPTAGCLYRVGCKGRWSNCPWNLVGWVNGVGGPTRTGGVCTGCTMPGFPDAYEPFWRPRGGRGRRWRGGR